MKKLVLAASVVAALTATTSQAAPISLKNGPQYFQFNNLEQLSTSNAIDTSTFSNLYLGKDNNGNDVTLTAGSSEGNWGVFNISSIQDGAVATPHQDINGGTTYFADGLTPGQVTGVFYGINLTSGSTATGGYIDLYWDDTPDVTNTDLSGNTFAPSARTDWNAAGKFTNGTFLARLEFATGILSDASNTTIASNVDLTTTLSGHSDSFANVMDVNGDGVIDAADGAWAHSMNTDWFQVTPDGATTETRDLRFSTFFNGLATWDGTGVNGAPLAGLRSNDPGRVFVVPEPSMIALMGAGLLGLAFGARRRKA